METIKLNTLYKKTSNCKIQHNTLYVEGCYEYARIITKRGYIGGTIIEDINK
jgi:hypothetical protein